MAAVTEAVPGAIWERIKGRVAGEGLVQQLLQVHHTMVDKAQLAQRRSRVRRNEHHSDLKPNHLFSGKHPKGTADRR